MNSPKTIANAGLDMGRLVHGSRIAHWCLLHGLQWIEIVIVIHFVRQIFATKTKQNKNHTLLISF